MCTCPHPLNLPLTTLLQESGAQKDRDLESEQKQNMEWKWQSVQVNGKFL